MLKRIIIILGLFALVCYLAVAGVIYRIGSEPMSCKEVKVNIKDIDEKTFLTESDILQLFRKLKLKLVGNRVDSINTYEIVRLIENNKLVRRAYCYHTPDSSLRVDIEQRKPVLRVQSTTIGDFYIDKEKIFMPVQVVIPMQIPIATGYISKETVENELLPIAEYLSDNGFWRDAITQIYVNTNGDIELIPRVGHHSILIGDSYNLEEKLDNVRTFYDKVLNKKGWNYYKIINVKFANQVIGEK
ncbi:MAG: hypothetical protein HUJ97_02500 [Bacteroidales bacterium]|nr:hypothetical protein [Bacteroidales bacterium]